MARLLRLWKALEQVLAGMDYLRYCEHMRIRHPDQPVLSGREYYLARIRERYSRPSRCC
jgi:uncharacterized short protein YbdD (DUF466 family)